MAAYNRGKRIGLINRNLTSNLSVTIERSTDVADNAYHDGMNADKAIAELQKLIDKPFFITWLSQTPSSVQCAKTLLGSLSSDSIKLPTITDWPKDMPVVAATNWGELRAYSDIPEIGNLGEDKTRELIHGYFAC